MVVYDFKPNKKLQDYGFPIMEIKKMAKLSEEAKNYVPPTTKNISELDSVSVDVDVLEKEVQKDNGETFKYKYIVVKDEEYRVGASVLKQLKAQLEENSSLKTFKVKKEGEGLKTVYTVIPL